MRLLPLALVAALLAGCGYVASPLAPLVKIPSRVMGLAAIQRGGRVIVQFTVPRLTTEGAEIEPPMRVDLRIGTGPIPWNADQWAALATRIPETEGSPSHKPLAPGASAHYEVPAAEWVGKDVVAAVMLFGSNGKTVGWSNLVNLSVIAPLDRPANLAGQVTPDGLRLTWQARGEHFRVLRATGTFEHYDVVATVTQPEWTDAQIHFGTPYRYIAQTFVPQKGDREAQSDLSEPLAITPEPIAPRAPTGLHAVTAPNSIELSWDGNSEPDVTAYRIYRGTPGGPLEKVGETGSIPSYSDRGAPHNCNYRYAVSAVGGSGKESPQSSTTDVAYP
jgi:hypothetical protein